MRELTLSNSGQNTRSRLYRNHTQRLSFSCPSLCPIHPVALNTHENPDPGSDPDLLVDCSANSSPTHFPPTGRHLPHGIQGVDRRRSWTDLEDSRRGSRRSGQDHHLHLQARSMVRWLKTVFELFLLFSLFLSFNSFFILSASTQY